MVWTPKTSPTDHVHNFYLDLRYGSPKHITRDVFSRYIFSKILPQNVQNSSPRFYYYILYSHTFLVKTHGHRGGQGVLVKGKGTWAPGAGPRPGLRAAAQGSRARAAALGPGLGPAHGAPGLGPGAHVPLPLTRTPWPPLWPCDFTRKVWKSHI